MNRHELMNRALLVLSIIDPDAAFVVWQHDVESKTYSEIADELAYEERQMRRWHKRGRNQLISTMLLFEEINDELEIDRFCLVVDEASTTDNNLVVIRRNFRATAGDRGVADAWLSHVGNSEEPSCEGRVHDFVAKLCVESILDLLNRHVRSEDEPQA